MTASIRDLRVETVPVSALKPYVNNPRTHSKRQIEQVAASIRTFGWTNPILVSDDLEIVAGHGRLEAARSLGLGEVPVMRLSGMSEAQQRAYVIADNRLAETAGWDEDLLRLEIGALIEMDLEFEIEAIGFETGEIDVLMAGEVHSADPESLPEPEEGPAVSELGDVWRLGRHRLVCGDACRLPPFALPRFAFLAWRFFLGGFFLLSTSALASVSALLAALDCAWTGRGWKAKASSPISNGAARRRARVRVIRGLLRESR